MELKEKIIISILLIITLFLGSFLVYREFQYSKQSKLIESSILKQKELSDFITRSQSSYVSKSDLDDSIKKLDLKPIKDDLDTLNAKVSSINTIRVSSQGLLSNGVPSSAVAPNNASTPITANCGGEEIVCNDPYHYQTTIQKLSLNETFPNILVPFGEVNFSAANKNPWGFSIYQRDYNVATVVAVDENQNQFVYNKFTIQVDNKKYDIKINQAEVIYQFPESLFQFNPRFFMGIESGLNFSDMKLAVFPNISFQLLSYGKYKTNPDFSFLQLGLGYDFVSREPSIMVSPIYFNVNPFFTFLKNTYLGGSFSVFTSGQFNFSLGLKVSL